MRTHAIEEMLNHSRSFLNLSSLPADLRLKPLTSAHVDKVNSAWPHRYDGSDQMILYSIKYHHSLGLYTELDELIAWCLMYDNGSLAILQVDDNHLRKGYGSLMAKAMSKKIAEEFEIDVTTLIARTNSNSQKMFAKLGFKETAGGHKWFTMKHK